MYVKRLSENKLYTPLASGGLWRTWRLFLFSGIRHYPPKPCGGANHKTSKGLTNIRHLDTIKNRLNEIIVRIERLK